MKKINMKKINMTIGKFQPFTKGHINMIEEGEELCIVYRINTDDKVPADLSSWKVQGRKVKKEAIQNVVNYLENDGQGSLTEQEKEILKRPFTNDLVDKELEIVEKNTKNILEIVPVKTMYDALYKFNKFITDHADEYEPCYWMCGDDRVEAYTEAIEKYDELPLELGGTDKIPNILKGKLKTNIGKGRTEGISGTAVRKSIITKDKSAFEKIMPKGVGVMFNEFTAAFDAYKNQLQGLIKEWKMTSLKEYIYESINNNEIKQNIINILNIKPKTLSSLREKIVKFSNKLDEYGIGESWNRIKSENLSEPFNIKYNNKTILIMEAYNLMFFSTPNFIEYRLSIMMSSDNDCYFKLYENTPIYKSKGKFGEIVGPYTLGTNFLDYLKSINNKENFFNDKNLSIISLLNLKN